MPLGLLRRDLGADPLPWRKLVTIAFLTALLAGALTLIELSSTRDVNGWLIHTGPEGPAAALLKQDFPDDPQFKNAEHDGPMFYAIAKYPTDLDTASQYLDQPRYRLQRPVYSWVSRVLFPPGEGAGLVWAMFATGVIGTFIGALALGAMGWMLGGNPLIALVVGLMPGTLMSLRISAADCLALGLMLAAVAVSMRGHALAAVLIAVVAVLTKEYALVSLFGFALWRRDRKGIALVAVPFAIAAAWALFLIKRVPSGLGQPDAITVPFKGLYDAVHVWFDGGSPLSLMFVPIAIVVAILGTVRAGLRHPVTFAVLGNLALLVVWNVTVVGLDRNATRTIMPLLALGAVQLQTARSSRNAKFLKRRIDPRRTPKPSALPTA